jgi:hypothetical protein
METYLVPLTFPDLDTATRDAPTFVDALAVAGVGAELVDPPASGDGDDAGRPDPGPTSVELRVDARDADDLRARVQPVLDGQFPPGTVLMGEPIPAPRT